MPRYFPLPPRVEIVEVPIGDGSNVETERLQYDNRNTAKRAAESVAAQANIATVAKRAVEQVTAALAADVLEPNERSAEAVTFEAATQDQAQRAADAVSAVASVAEPGQRADDTIQAIIIPTTTQAKRAVEDISASVTGTANELGQRASDQTQIEIADATAAQKAVDTIDAEFEILEQAKRALEDVSNTVTAALTESAKRAQDEITATVIPTTTQGQRAESTDTIEITVEAFLDSVVSNTGFTNPNNALGDTTGTAATLTATSSGLLGTTNNTTNGTHVARFRDINLGSDTTITSVVLRVENQHANQGLPLVQPTCNIQFQYSTNSGSSWTTFYTLTGQTGKGIRTQDLTGVIGQNRALLAGGVFRVRATGSVTSGTGLGAGSTASYFRAWLTVLANRSYT